MRTNQYHQNAEGRSDTPVLEGAQIRRTALRNAEGAEAAKGWCCRGRTSSVTGATTIAGATGGVIRSAAFTCGLSSRSPAAQHALAIDGPSQSSERSQHSMRALGELFHPMHVDTWCVPTVISRAKATATRTSLIDPIVAEPLIRCKSPFGVLELRIVKAF